MFGRLRKESIGNERRTVFFPKRRSREKIQQQREELGLSGSETYQLLAPLSGKVLLESEPMQNVLAYCADWELFIVNKEPKVNKNSPLTVNPQTGEIYLPNPFVIPSKSQGKSRQWGDTQFYWDEYFIGKALVNSNNPRYLQIAKGQIDNFEYIFNLLGYIPNGSEMPIVTRSQTPYLTGMIMDIYEATGDKKWLDEKIAFAKKEYYDVWMYTEKDREEKGLRRPSHRISEDSLLLRYVGTDIINEHYAAAAAGTEDDSKEWAGRAHETVPITLNCAVYKYEKEFAEAARILGRPEEAAHWEAVAEKRKQEINEKMWDEREGTYFNLQLNRDTGKWEKGQKVLKIHLRNFLSE